MGMLGDIAVKIEMKKLQEEIERWENDGLPPEQILANIKTYVQNVMNECDWGYR